MEIHCPRCKSAIDLKNSNQFKVYFGSHIVCPSCNAKFAKSKKKELLSVFGFTVIIYSIFLIDRLFSYHIVLGPLVFLLLLISGGGIIYYSKTIRDYCEK